MNATFGKLDGDTLRLDPGMNEITAPNEWGKSTWCAFLIAMLYGVDTRERSGRETLADKEHYAPWSGKPMEGTLRVEFEGRDITIARRTRGKVPLGDFCAIETNTGLPVRELTAANCGQTLLGVERSVFRRSGFIRFGEMPVTQDEALRRRLNSLVTTADESGAADHLAEKLRELKNKVRYNKTGLIPYQQERIRELEAQLRERQAMERKEERLEEEELRTRQALLDLENHKRWLAYEEAQQDALQVERAGQAVSEAGQRLLEQKERCATLPRRPELEERLPPERPVQPTLPRPELSAILAGLALIAAAMLFFLDHPAAAVVAAAAALVLAVVGGLALRRRKTLIADYEEEDEEYQRTLRQLGQWDDLERCREELVKAREHLTALETMARTAEAPEVEDKLSLNPAETEQTLSRGRDQLRQIQLELGQCRGRMEHLPEARALEQQLTECRARLGELELTYTALGYAQKALEEATEELQRRFAPRITQRAQEFLTRLTDGRYGQLQLNQELSLRSAAAGEVTARSARWRSDGTVDQMYLALRLAVWEELMPQGPLVLDDALVRFDDTRRKAAMELLKELAKERQVIIFSCK